ncbi:UNVERIFIED_CONTAM: WRKY transcription factor 72A [Sesamum latifolium]|uniref:WRKY transcription factor 72A n=1 Tax=Sesamum latifolium TaxID=2727402 RepID=A0AAW2UY84_9LAMI
MEMISTSLHKSGVLRGAAKEEKKASESDSAGKKSCGGEIVLKLEDKLVSAKSEMDEVMEENQRLRMCLNRIMEDYRTLEMQYRDVIQQEAKKSPTHQDHETEEPELIALSLGRTSSGKIIRDERNKMPTVEKSAEGHEGLTLGLDCKLDVPKMLLQAETTSLNPSPENSLEEVKEEEGGSRHGKIKQRIMRVMVEIMMRSCSKIPSRGLGFL